MKPKVKLKSKSQLIRELDSVFSKYIRTRGSHKNTNKCITCGTQLPIEKLQCGHYYSRKILSLRWDEENCHPQCVKCNIFQEGEKPKYALALIKKYGNKILFKLESKANNKTNYTIKEIKDKIEYYKTKLRG